jgi:uncharacterized protein with HEPN domain
MSKREPAILLDDIRAAIGKIERYIRGLDQQSFLVDEKTIDAVVRNLEVIGEAAKQLPAEFKKQHGLIPWSRIAGLRNHRARLRRYRSRTCLEHFKNGTAGVIAAD